MAGTHAARIALGLGAQVIRFDISAKRLSFEDVQIQTSKLNISCACVKQTLLMAVLPWC